MGRPFIKRRERPLTMRLAVVTIMVCLLVTGLFTVTPLTGFHAGWQQHVPGAVWNGCVSEPAQLSLVYGSVRRYRSRQSRPSLTCRSAVSTN